MNLKLLRGLRLLRASRVAGLLAGLLALTGCGPGAGTVTGTVTYQGKALTYGNVQIRSQAGSVFVGAIGSDGTYAIPGVPTGPAQVSVSAIDPKFEEKMRELVGGNHLPASGDDNPGRVARGRETVDRAQYAAVPLTYEPFETSTLAVEVKRGETRYDIPLK